MAAASERSMPLVCTLLDMLERCSEVRACIFVSICEHRNVSLNSYSCTVILDSILESKRGSIATKCNAQASKDQTLRVQVSMEPSKVAPGQIKFDRGLCICLPSDLLLLQPLVP